MCKKHSFAIFCKKNILCTFEVHTNNDKNKNSFIKKY